MKRNPSWKILGESVEKSQKYIKTDIYDILEKSINYSNTINEDDLSKLDELIIFARENGWHPTVSKYLDVNNIHEAVKYYEGIVDIQKDELIWEYNMLLKESYTLKEFGMEDDEYDKFMTQLLSFKDIL